MVSIEPESHSPKGLTDAPLPNRPHVYSSELSLFDVWSILKKHKKLFWSVFVLVSLMGLLFTFFKPPTYRFSQLMEVGSYFPIGKDGSLSNERISLIGSGDVQSIYQSVVVPVVKQRFGNQIDVQLKTSEDSTSNLFILKGEGSLKQEKIYQGIFNQILLLLNKVQTVRSSNIESNLTAQIESKNEALKNLRKENTTLIARTTSADNHGADLLRAQILGDVYVSKQREMQNLQATIALMKMSMHSILPNRFVSQMSAMKVGVSKGLLLVLDVLLALVLAFVVVFIKEFFGRGVTVSTQANLNRSPG